MFVPDAATPGRPADRRDRLCGGRSSAGSWPLPGRGSCSAGTPTAATARPGPTRDPRFRTAAVCRHQHMKEPRYLQQGLTFRNVFSVRVVCVCLKRV